MQAWEVIVMSKTIGIAYGYYRGSWIGHNTNHLFELLQTRFAEHEIEVQKVGLLDTQINIFQNQLDVVDLSTQKSLLELDGMYFANWRKQPEFSLATAELLKRHKKPILSEEVLQVMPMSKLGEMIHLSDKGIKLPNSVFMRSKHWLKLIKNKQKLPFEFPFIFKVIDGSMGEENYLVNNSNQLKEIIKQDLSRLFVAQELIPNTHDYRVIIIGGQPRLAIKRARLTNDTHLNNTSQGAAGELIELNKVDSAILEIAKKAALATKRQSFSGVDIIQNSQTGDYYVLEVNKTPQMETGTNTAEKVEELVNYFVNELEQKHES
jgi:glutathione synthase/RimK-type ligase-like ATP-grasp enzyme